MKRNNRHYLFVTDSTVLAYPTEAFCGRCSAENAARQLVNFAILQACPVLDVRH